MFKFHYVIAKHNEEIYDKYIAKSMVGKRPIIVEDSPELNSMTKKYNEGIKRIGKLTKNDSVVFIHEDVNILDPHFEGKIAMIMASNPDIGVLGVYGTTQYAGGGWWSFERNTYAVGSIMQMVKDGRIYNMRDNLPPNMINKDIVTVDGCMMVVRADVLKQMQFDENIKGYHQYDNSFCLELLLNTKYKVAVCDVNILHASEGEPNEDWMNESMNLINRYKGLGLNIPLTSKNIKEVNNGKV